MYSSEFIRFLIGRDADDFINNEKKETENTSEGNIIYRYSRLATVPIEIKK